MKHTRVSEPYVKQKELYSINISYYNYCNHNVLVRSVMVCVCSPLECAVYRAGDGIK